jgi:hypothetical protein
MINGIRVIRIQLLIASLCILLGASALSSKQSLSKKSPAHRALPSEVSMLPTTNKEGTKTQPTKGQEDKAVSKPNALPSDEIERAPQQLRSWLMGLSDEELAQLVGTTELDRYVKLIIRSLAEEIPSNQVELFLHGLNLRIATVQMNRKG